MVTESGTCRDRKRRASSRETGGHVRSAAAASARFLRFPSEPGTSLCAAGIAIRKLTLTHTHHSDSPPPSSIQTTSGSADCCLPFLSAPSHLFSPLFFSPVLGLRRTDDWSGKLVQRDRVLDQGDHLRALSHDHDIATIQVCCVQLAMRKVGSIC